MQAQPVTSRSCRTSLASRIAGGALLVLLATLVRVPLAGAEPIAVHHTEGVARGFPVLKSLDGEVLARGDLSQVPHGDRVESRLVFRFTDGSLYDEAVTFSQGSGVFTLLRYRIVQRGPSFPETVVATVDRETGEWTVRYRADDESPEEALSGRIDLPADVYNGMLGLLLKNLPADRSATVRIIAFTPRPRLAPGGEPLEAGMVLSVRARAFVAGEAGVEIAETVLVAQRGVHGLNRSRRGLVVLD
ncbi:MAG TPA: hypothetical protein VNN07_13400 [Candidatus Tectomicrobia bacterium]|nr:hypothetical protein [Candidatus Tectomicrobia bacterium]